MTFTHALATNNYGTVKFIVDANPANGTHTTLASAMSSASSGDTISLRTSVTENVTITPGVNIVAYPGNQSTVSITGKLTMTDAGTSTVKGIRLITNNDFLLAVTGSELSIINLVECDLQITNNTAISFTTSSASAQINLNKCTGNITTTGITLFSSSSAGILATRYTQITNSGNATTASTISAGIFSSIYSNFEFAITTSGTASFLDNYSLFITVNHNTISLTSGGSGTHGLVKSTFNSGTAASLSISNTLTASDITVISTNTNPITGAGTFVFDQVSFRSTGVGINVTTLTSRTVSSGVSRSTLQPAFNAYLATSALNKTGDGTTYTIGTDALTEVFDQGGDFNTNGTFTAPVTGRYQLSAFIVLGGVAAAHTGLTSRLITSNATYAVFDCNPGAIQASGFLSFSASFLVDMDATETATWTVQVSGSTLVVDIIGGARATTFTTLSGFLVC